MSDGSKGVDGKMTGVPAIGWTGKSLVSVCR